MAPTARGMMAEFFLYSCTTDTFLMNTYRTWHRLYPTTPVSEELEADNPVENSDHNTCREQGHTMCLDTEQPVLQIHGGYAESFIRQYGDDHFVGVRYFSDRWELMKEEVSPLKLVRQGQQKQYQLDVR